MAEGVKGYKSWFKIRFTNKVSTFNIDFLYSFKGLHTW